MKCCVSSCKMYSDRRSDAMIGVTFHALPSEANVRKEWISKIGKKNWTPSKHAKICSIHFNKDDLFVTGKGFRKIRIGAVPCLKLDNPEDPLNTSQDRASSPVSSDDEILGNIKSNAQQIPDFAEPSTSQSQNKHMKGNYTHLSSYQNNQLVKLKLVQQKNRRLLKRNEMLKQKLQEVELSKSSASKNEDFERKMLHKRNLRLLEKNKTLVGIVKKLKEILRNRNVQLLTEKSEISTSTCRVCGTYNS